MGETLIKTCGITQPDDAAFCLDLGVDLLGLVFAFSTRHVTIAQARVIRAAVPGARLVGVCVDEPLETLLELARECGLDMLQLHGRESAAYCHEAARRTSLPVIKAVRVGNGGSRGNAGSEGTGGNGGDPDLETYRGLHGLLFDLDKGAPPSREAIEGLWSRAAEACARGHRVFLAGALDPGNVAEAVRRVRPHCVDVARGVERAPGVKDRDRVIRFLEEVRRA